MLAPFIAPAMLALSVGCSCAAEIPHTTASTPPVLAPVAASAGDTPASAVVVSDVAHWKHPTQAVFEKYKVTLQSVSVQDRHATFQVAFPFDLQTGPNEARLQAFCLELLKANGSWAYALVSSGDHVEIDVAWDRKAGRIGIDSHAI